MQRERNVKTQAWREDGHMKTVTGIGASGRKLRNGSYPKLGETRKDLTLEVVEGIWPC